jgi:hypothetical protein
MKPKTFLIFLILLSFGACKPDQFLSIEDRTRIHCAENMQFECRNEPPEGISFFRANIGGQEYCVSAVDEHYSFYLTFGTLQYTPASDPVLRPETPIMARSVVFKLNSKLRYGGYLPYEFLPDISLRTPFDTDTVVHPMHYYVDKYIPRQGRLPLKETIISIDGFGVDWHWYCYHLGVDYWQAWHPDSGHTRIPFVGAGLRSYTDRSRNVKMWVETFEREEIFEDAIHYRIVFRFEGSFYYSREGFGNVEVKNGIFDMNFVLPK